MCEGGSDGLAIKTCLKGESSFRFIRKTRRTKRNKNEALSLQLSLSLSLSLEFWPSVIISFLNWEFGFEFVELDCVNVDDLIEAFSSESVELGEIHSKGPKWKSIPISFGAFRRDLTLFLKKSQLVDS